MASAFPESYNPFEAPTTASGATLTGPAGTDVELIRRHYLKHETSVRSIGWLSYLGAFFSALSGIFNGLMVTGVMPMPPQQQIAGLDPRIGPIINIMLAVVFGAVNVALGYGLRRLQVWSRWTMVVFGVISVLICLVVIGVVLVAFGANPIGGAVAGIYFVGLAFWGYILYLLLSEKGAMVFSPGYREVIRQTPHIRYKTSILIKIGLGLLIALLTLAVVGAIVGGVRR